MWSQIGLCLLVGFAFASNSPGWEKNTEYVYSIRGRTLASLHEVANQYNGILLKAQLLIQCVSDDKLNAKISNAQYAPVHSQLADGWNTYVPDAEVGYKPLGMSNLPFQIEMKNGVITDLIVDKSVPNWEANIIKSIISQFQLDTTGQNSYGEGLSGDSEGEESQYVFKTMEETITGNTETSYDIHPLPEYTLQGEEGNWPSHLLKLKGDRDIIEVVKNKNYSNSMELPSYHYGFAGIGNWKPAGSQMGDFFIRGSISRAILTGNLKRYTVHNTYTVNEIMVSPTLNNKQKGSVVSLVNVTLKDIKSPGQNLEVPSPVNLGGLVYTYDNPSSDNNEAGQRKLEDRQYLRGRLDRGEYERYQRAAFKHSGNTAKKFGDVNMEGSFSHTNRILRRSSNQEYQHQGYDESSEYSAIYKQKQPQTSEVPAFPLLPYSTGFHGKSIKQEKNVNIAQSVKKIAQSIGNELQDPEDCQRENTLDKFTLMTSLIRIMDEKEIQQVASELYSQAKDGPQHDSWAAFRDGVAEAGTGPAYLIIKNWIESEKIKDDEAAHIVSTMTKAVRVPTVDYMQSLFDLIKKPEVQNQDCLNETALMAFTNLVRRVYVNPRESKNQYPVQSFGSFRTEEGKKMVEDVTSYLSQRLDEAISRADAPQIHVYIRALGNVAHPKILSAYEPYLEGKKQASQFQRLLMVVAMDMLAQTYPEMARSVLYNVYQNAGETQEVRVAAVYQLMRTQPPTSMLQRMASYTNIDYQEHVNAAVKSSIESAAELEGKEYHELRSSTQAAKSLLTKEEYGLQHGGNYLRSYVIRELKTNYKQTLQIYAEDQGYYPKGLQYSLRANLDGLRDQLVKFKAMVSSIQELIHVGRLQTASYRKQMDEQKQNANEQQQQQYSSQKIAQLLKIEIDEKEQLEGNIYGEFDDYFQHIMSFDNHTIEQWPEVIRKYEEELKNGKQFHHTKLTNNREMALAFPTETGLPFLYTYDTPSLYKVTGKLQSVASPQVSQDNKLHQPDTVAVQSTIGVTVHSKIEGRLCFFTPFDHQQYISGYDKNFQAHVPLDADVNLDLKNGQIKASINPQQWPKNGPLLHYSTWPYTSKKDIKDFQPISAQQNTHYIRQRNLRSYDKVLGQKETGMAWHVKINHERQSASLAWLHEIYQHGSYDGLLSLWDDASLQYSEITVRHLSEKSSVRNLVVNLGLQEEYRSQSQGSGNGGVNWEQLSQQSDPLSRQKSLLDSLCQNIKNAYAQVAEISVQFNGDKDIKHTVTGGYGKSNVDPKCRVLGYYQKSSSSQDVKPYEIALEVESEIPNTNGLDLSYSMKHEPKLDSDFRVRFGSTKQSSSEIEGQLKCRRSERRKQYLQEQPLYQQCQREMRNGDYQLPACANLTMSSNLLDEVRLNVQYQKVKQDVIDTCESIYDALKVYYYPSLKSDKHQGTRKENQIKLNAKLDPDLRYVNVSVQTSGENSTVSNIFVGEWGRTLFAAHPVFHVRSRIMSYILGQQTYRPICVVDQTSINTFDNRTYPADLDKHWTVALQYLPAEGRHSAEPRSAEEQLMYQTENYVVLTRQNSQQGKDVKITLSSPETGYKLKEITLSAAQQQSSGKKVSVKVDGQEAPISDQESHDIGDGYVQIYGLPNGEVKVEIRDAFYVICDGRRMKLTALNGKFRNSVRGLCGTFNEDAASDYLTPQGCILRDYKKFIKSYNIESPEAGQRSNLQECVQKDSPLYANVISNSEEKQGGSYPSDDCTKVQTRYREEGDQICFTVRELPVCSSHCQQRESTTKSVSVYCMKKSNVADHWKNQIDKGLSPGFGHKQPNKVIKMDLPTMCSNN